MKGSFTEDPAFEKVHQEKDVLELHKLLNTINFNYWRNEESNKTLWQTDKDFIDLKTNI